MANDIFISEISSKDKGAFFSAKTIKGEINLSKFYVEEIHGLKRGSFLFAELI
jgi:hypothetical protein